MIASRGFFRIFISMYVVPDVYAISFHDMIGRLMALDDSVSRAARRAFADEFRTARIDAELTQVQVAVKAGVSPNHVSAIENSRHDTRISTMVRLAEAVGKKLEIRLTNLPVRKRKSR